MNFQNHCAAISKTNHKSMLKDYWNKDSRYKVTWSHYGHKWEQGDCGEIALLLYSTVLYIFQVPKCAGVHHNNFAHLMGQSSSLPPKGPWDSNKYLAILEYVMSFTLVKFALKNNICRIIKINVNVTQIRNCLDLCQISLEALYFDNSY